MIKNIIYFIALLVGLLALVIGFIGQTQPTLFLSIPNVGFLFYAIIAGKPIPPYFTGDAWEKEEMKTWIRDGDVVVATGVKSGTTWMLYCSHVIRTKANASVDFGDVSLTTPWPDLIQVPGMSWAEHKEGFHNESLKLTNHNGKRLVDYWNHESFPFRIFKSHMTPKESGGETGILPIRDFPKVKFLAMARNGLDVVSSLVPFFNSHRDEFRTIWGGFPPRSSGNIDIDKEDRIKELLPGGNLYQLYFPYIQRWWPMRHESNVLLLHYSDAKRDMRGTVAKLADFYEVHLTDSELDAATEMCSFKYMKEKSHLFSYELPLNPSYSGTIMYPGSMIRKGENGDGKGVFNEEQQQRWRQTEEEELPDPVLRKWAKDGGDAKLL